MSYHVNPKTGNPGQCKAKKQCPFGGMENHYATQEEAAKSYEKAQEKYEAFVALSVIPQSKGAYTLAVFDRLDPNVLQQAVPAMIAAPNGARLVVENGQVWEKNTLYGDDSWRFATGEYEPMYRLEPKKTYDGNYARWLIKDHGGRLEAGGRRQEPYSEARPRVAEPYREFAKEVNKKVHEVTGANANISQENETLYFIPEQNLTKKEISTVLKSSPHLQYASATVKVSLDGPRSRVDGKARFFTWTSEL